CIAAGGRDAGLGLDPVEVDKTWHGERPMTWILESPNAGGIVPPGAALVDHAALLDALLDQAPPGSWPAPFREFQERRARMLTDRTEADGTMGSGDIVRALAAGRPAGAVVTARGGADQV